MIDYQKVQVYLPYIIYYIHHIILQKYKVTNILFEYESLRFIKIKKYWKMQPVFDYQILNLQLLLFLQISFSQCTCTCRRSLGKIALDTRAKHDSWFKWLLPSLCSGDKPSSDTTTLHLESTSLALLSWCTNIVRVVYIQVNFIRHPEFLIL